MTGRQEHAEQGWSSMGQTLRVCVRKRVFPPLNTISPRPPKNECRPPSYKLMTSLLPPKTHTSPRKPPPHTHAHLDVEAFDRHGSCLPHAPGAPDGLLLQCWVDAGLQQEHVVGGCQVDAHSTRADGQQEHSRGGVTLERLCVGGECFLGVGGSTQHSATQHSRRESKGQGENNKGEESGGGVGMDAELKQPTGDALQTSGGGGKREGGGGTGGRLCDMCVI